MNDLHLISPKQRDVITDHFGLPLDELGTTETRYGHMASFRRIISAPDGRKIFIKAHKPDSFVDDQFGTASQYAARDLSHLDAEARALIHLNRVAANLVPQVIDYRCNTLLTEYLFDQNWTAPRDVPLDQYFHDAAAAFTTLQETPAPEWITDSTMSWLVANSWSEIDFSMLPTENRSAIEALRKDGEAAARNIDTTFPTHHDAQQNNIGWRPDQGARLVDPSWYGLGPLNADTTMLIIDLAGCGHDVQPFMNYFNPLYSWLRAGNWLKRSTIPPNEIVGNAPVRKHQLESALTALRLLGIKI